MTRREAAAYLAAIIDGEGSVSYKPDVPGSARGKRIVRIANTDPDIIAASTAALRQLHIAFRLHEIPRRSDHHKPGWEISISTREGLTRLLDSVPIQSSAKRDRLREAVTTYRFPITPSSEVLERLYFVEQLSAKDIGARFGVSASTAYHWLLKRGIRPRSLSEALTIRKARERALRA